MKASLAGLVTLIKLCEGANKMQGLQRQIQELKTTINQMNKTIQKLLRKNEEKDNLKDNWKQEQNLTRLPMTSRTIHQTRIHGRAGRYRQKFHIFYTIERIWIGGMPIQESNPQTEKEGNKKKPAIEPKRITPATQRDNGKKTTQ